MLPKLRQWRALAPADRACVRRAARLLPVIRVGLQVFGLRRTQAWLARRGPVMLHGPAEEAGRARQIVRLVGLAARYQRLWSNCLAHSLTLWALLRREGIPAEIRIGARLRDGRFEAHAWVEWRGEPLSDPGDGSYAAFARPVTGETP